MVELLNPVVCRTTNPTPLVARVILLCPKMLGTFSCWYWLRTVLVNRDRVVLRWGMPYTWYHLDFAEKKNILELQSRFGNLTTHHSLSWNTGKGSSISMKINGHVHFRTEWYAVSGPSPKNGTSALNGSAEYVYTWYPILLEGGFNLWILFCDSRWMSPVCIHRPSSC